MDEKRYKSEIMLVLHQDAEGLFQVGAISEKEMRRYDRDCLVQERQPKPKAVRSTKRALASASG
jgi:DNA-binding transcriptional regulator YiaG